jgi:uncharacterized delta-60 repeat protein
MKTITSILTAFILLPTFSFSQPGTLDSSFGINGKKVKPKGAADAIAIQSDGKIIAGGYNHLGSKLVRYNQNGSIDKTFGINGEVVIDANISSTLHAIVLTTDNKIITAGSDSKNFEIVKLNNNGSFDSSFGINGKVSTNFLGKDDEAYSVAIEPNNKIVAVGTAFEQSGETTRIAVARYNPDGSLDSSFSYDGKVAKNISYYHFDDGYSVILQPNGKIVVTGDSYTNPGTALTDFILIRFKSNGDIDKTFGNNGYTITDFGGFESARYAAQQSNGKIIIVGSSYNSGTGESKTILARYTINGKLDSTFGLNGINNKLIASGAIAIQPDDKILVAGGGVKVARFKKNGFSDNSFGNNGVFVIDSTNRYETVNAIALQKSGKIIAAGDSSAEDGYDNNYLIVRLKNYVPKSNVVTKDLLSITQNNFVNTDIKIYPNPVKDILHVTGINEKSMISIFNEEGKLEVQATATNRIYNVDIKQLPAGIYYLQVTSQNKKSITLKFIRQ